MSEPKKDEHLLINIVTMFTQQAWVAMGKLKNPITEKTERNLQEASFYIDIIDMMKRKMAGNLSEDEEKFLDSSLSGLKMNYLEESNKPNSEDSSKENEKSMSDSESDAEEASADKEETDDVEYEKAKPSDESSEREESE